MNPHLLTRALLLTFMGWAATASGAWASEPKVAYPRSWANPLRYRDAVIDGIHSIRHLEGVEMVLAIAGGSQMGPGEGWFHGGQSRYDWKWLTGRFQATKDGKIERKTFTGDLALFDKLDRNHDGELTAEDFDWSDQAAFLRQSGLAAQWLAKLDGNSNGRVSKAEWEAFFEKAAKGKDHLTTDDLRDAVYPPPPPKSEKGSGGPSPLTLIAGLFNGELGSWHEGPGIGDPAPDFLLKTQDGKGLYSLSQFKGKKPVVLIFGSFT
jgi:hypothetical protein